MGEAVLESAHMAAPSHRSTLLAPSEHKSSHHRLTHRIAGPFVQQPRLNATLSAVLGLQPGVAAGAERHEVGRMIGAAFVT